MPQPTSRPILENLLILRRTPKPDPLMCDNCLYGHALPCSAPGVCRCVCKRDEHECRAA